MSSEEQVSSPGWNGGVLLIAGGTDYENVTKRPTKGKKGSANDEARSEFYQDLLSPHQFSEMSNIKISFISSGAAASHAFAVDMEGRPYAWGRNLEGQLGLGDRRQRNQPTLIDELEDIVSVACGRAHSAFVTGSGEVFTTGDNKFGQLGCSTSVEQSDTPVAVKLSHSVIKVVCGSDFTLMLTRDGSIYGCGSGESGTLGDGSTHMYNVKASSIKMEVEAQPTPKAIPGLRNVVNLAAGLNHAVCVTKEGAVYTWGCGDYGRLGHGVQKDELRPRAIEMFQGPRAVPSGLCQLSCGGTCTMLSNSHGTFWWGKVKTSGDAMMTPTMCQDLRGWELRSMSLGKTTFGVTAETSCILWGNAIHGELAGGIHGKKSSASPAKCMPLETLVTKEVACGNGFTVFLIDVSDKKSEKKVMGFDVYDAAVVDPFAVETETKASPPAKKRAAPKRKRAS